MNTISMCKLKNHNIATLSQSIKAHYYLIKLTQLFISVSLFSFIFSPSSLFVFLHYFKFYFSTFPFQLFTHNIDKNSMFLLCNCLLVFVAITTKSFSGSSSYDDDKISNLQESSSQYVEDDGSHSQSYVLDVEANEALLERKEAMKETSIVEQEIEITKTCCEEEVEENIEKVIFIDEEEGKESSHLVMEEEVKEVVEEESELFDVVDEEENKGSETDCFLNEESLEEEEDVEEEEICVISTEELNKKFEDFIRKMREDLRIEARRQLIMV